MTVRRAARVAALLALALLPLSSSAADRLDVTWQGTPHSSASTST